MPSPYTIQELKNLITDWIHENHERSITGVELQERLLDILDTLQAYTDSAVVEPAVNYYVNQILFDIATGALTLVRAGGIEPSNISIDLDGRYKRIDDAAYRSDQVSVPSGPFFVEFNSPFPESSQYTIPPIGVTDNAGALVWITPDPTKFTHLGFWIDCPDPSTFVYTATLIQ